MTGAEAERLEDLREKLDSIAEELSDIGRAKLFEALRSGSKGPEAEERRLGQARRAVLKAAGLLAAIGRDSPDDPDDGA